MPVHHTRRSFLAAAAAAPLALGLARRAAAAGQETYGGFLMGIQSYTLRNFPIDQVLAHVHDLGLKSIELFDAHFPHRSTAEQIAAMREKTRTLGIQMLGHGVNGFSRDHEANRRYFEFAKAAGIRNISADPSEDAFDSLDKLVAEFDVRIAIHNHGPGARYDKVADVLAPTWVTTSAPPKTRSA
jgi:sugar phosphate isomerase/epimerase